MAESADILLIDGEDAGESSPWEFDSVVENAGNSLELAPTAAMHGTKGYKLTFAGANRDCFGKVALAEPTDVYCRFYQKFVTVNATNGWGYVFTPFWDGIQNLLDIQFKYRSGTPAFGLRVDFYTNASGWITLFDKSAQDVIAINSEFYLEVRFKSAAAGGGAECWLNGVLQGSDLNYATSNRLPDSSEIGFTSGSAFGSGTVVHIDDVVFNTTGPIGEYVDTTPPFEIDGEDIEDVSPWEWSSVTKLGSNDFLLHSDAAKFGLKGYKASFDGVNEEAFGTKLLNPIDELYWRLYVFLPTGLSGQVSKLNYIGATRSTGLARICSIGLQTNGDGDVYRWYYGIAGGSSGGTETNFSLNAWHYIDLHWKKGTGANGGGEIWADGTLLTSQLTLDHTMFTLGSIRVGFGFWAGGLILDNGAYLYFDNIALALNGPIGPYYPPGAGGHAKHVARFLLLGGF